MLIPSRSSFLVLLTCLSLASVACGDTGGTSPGDGPGPNPPAPEPLTEIPLPLADFLHGREGVLDIVRLFQDETPVEEILPISGDTSSFTLPVEQAAALWFSVLGPQGALFESHGATSYCVPPFGRPIPRVLEVPTEFDTIQLALDASEPGDRVYVHPGTYHEHLRLRSGVRLIGAGATQTILDGDGAPQHLIDFSRAEDVVVRGFTLRNVGQGLGCVQSDDPFACTGDTVFAAVSGDGHGSFGDVGASNPSACVETSLQLTQNIIEGNDVGVMLYFHARALIHNNLFLGNQMAFVGSFLNDHALVANNVFYDNPKLSIGSKAGYIDIINNVVVQSSAGIEHENIQTGSIRCNVFFDVDKIGKRVHLGSTDGNVILDPGFLSPADHDFRLGVDLAATDLGCAAPGLHNVENASPEPGAFGGAMGGWYMQSIKPEDLVPAL